MRLTAFLIACTLTLGLQAQRFYFERLDVQNGLGTSKVFTVLQDSTGIVWLGTDDGLASFDGREREGVINYGAKDGLAPEGVVSLLLDSKQRLWIGHLKGGLSLRIGMDFLTAEPGGGPVISDITGITEDADGSIWIATLGDGALRVTDVNGEGRLTAERYGSEQGLLEHLRDVIRFKDGTIAFLEDGGTLKKWVPASKRFASLELRGLEDVLNVISIHEDAAERLWLGTTKDGAFVRDHRTGQVVNYTTANGLPSNMVTCFGEDAAGQVWVGAWGGGAAVIGLNGVRRHYFPGNGLESLQLFNISRDRDGNMLLATIDYGLVVFKGERFLNLMERDGLLDQQVWAVLEDRSGRLWFGTDGGVSILDPKVEGPGMIKTLQTQIARVRHIVEDANGQIWIGSETSGLMDLDPSAFQVISHEELQAVFKNNGKVTALVVGQPGELWIGTSKGLVRYATGAPLVVYGDGDGVPTTPVSALFRDDKGTIWVGSKEQGITRMDNGKPARVPLDGALTPTCFVQDGEGRLWVGTAKKGVLVLKDGKQVAAYTGKDGLLAEGVRSLVRDGDGAIWIGTVSGLNSWRPGQEGLLAYTGSSGFIGVEAKPNAVCLTRNGDMWFGTAKGATRVVPEKGGVKPKAPLVALRSLNINQEDRQLEQDLRLDHSERSIRIGYGSVSLSDPGAVRYAHLLEGLDTDWQPITASTEAYYPALPPGSYTFKVKSMNRAGLWSEQPAELRFTILPPWWQSWWFYTALTLVIALSVFSWIKVRERQLKLRNQILERKVQERTAEVVAQSKEIEGQKVRIEDLLLNILPKQISDELKDKGKATARRHDEVTVMFTDMKGFTKAAEKMTPEELVSELDECFIKFDEIIGRYGIEKIKTIGDSYMCASGVPSSDPHHAIKTAMAALEVREMMDQWRREHEARGKEPWILRIGLHTGPVVAGVVGKRKFAYDIWGDAVNTASRMESSGEPGEVNVSGATYAQLKDHFECVHRGQVEAKNKGKIDMYFVKRLKPEYSEDARGVVPNARFRKAFGLPEPVQELA